MNEHDVFVSGEAPADAVRRVIESVLGATFRPSEDAEPVPALIVGAAKVTRSASWRSRGRSSMRLRPRDGQ
jgi:hypothetical protein